MTDHTGTANTRGESEYTTISFTPTPSDVPPMTDEEGDRELVRDAMRNIKEGLAGIALWLMIIAICQVVTCGIAVLK